MASSDFKKLFNEEMSSEEAVHTYVRLLSRTPKEQLDALYNEFADIYEGILKRECEDVKKYGIM